MKSKKKSKPRFVIVSPRQLNGGPIVLHTLCKYLLDLGYDARIIFDYYVNNSITNKEDWKNQSEYSKFPYWMYVLYSRLYIIRFIVFFIIDIYKCFLVRLFPNYFQKNVHFQRYVNLSIKDFKRKYLPIVSKNTIVVYPEIIYGNPLKAKYVVHWFLFYSRFNGDLKAYGKDDLFICYRKIFNDSKLNPSGNELSISNFNLELYKRYNFSNRTGNCYIIRKGKNRKDLPQNFDGIIIDDKSEIEKVKIFNECEYCISYDTQTAYSRIAAMCGCKSIVVPEKGKSRSDYRNSEDKDFGVSWSFERKEIEYAQEEAKDLYVYFSCVNNQGKDDVSKFVKLCEKKWNLQ